MDSEKKILDEIDQMHQLANKCLAQKRFDDYINIFSDNLRYTQLDGNTRNKAEISKDTAVYFSRLKTTTGQYKRKSFVIEENTFTENLTQKASVSISVFIFFTKKWTVEREGIYTWVKHAGLWKIVEVEILSEKIN